MDSARSRILADFPYPVAYPYSLIFQADQPASKRRWALCFTEYQVLRMLCLPLVGQYLRERISENAHDSIAALNRAIAAIRSPLFSDWIALLHALRRHLLNVGIEPLFPQLAEALTALKQTAERPIGLRGNQQLNPLDAILALRNGTAHGGIPHEEEAALHVEAYLPILHQVLDAFDFLGASRLLVACDDPAAPTGDRARLRLLRGVQPAEPVEEELAGDLLSAFAESLAVLTMPGGKTIPLYPLCHPVTDQEPLYLYDGHYGIRVTTRQSIEERSYIYYLGIYHRAESLDAASCERLKELLAHRQISFFLTKEQAAPWTIADSAADYSRRTLEELIGTKYFPACYVPFTDLERHFHAFLSRPVPEPAQWHPDTTRRRYVNGLVLIGLAGAGKTALLARQVEHLLAQPDQEAGRENTNLVLFLRGNGIALRPTGMSLFRDLAEKLGVAVTGTAFKGGFSQFRELLDHLHGRWKQDRVIGRQLVLVFDALNEAPFAEQVIREALEMMGVAACYPWCKIILSTRQEWLSLWSGKLGAQESSPLEELRPFLYVAAGEDPALDDAGDDAEVPAARGSPEREGPPVVTVEPFDNEQARQVYGRYQTAAQPDDQGRPRSRIPACRTAWDELDATTRDLLTNPLYLHVFMEAFDGREAEPVRTVPLLFRRYVDRAMSERPGLRSCVDAVIGHLLDDLQRPTADLSDDDCNAIRQAWVQTHTPEEARLLLNPVEGLAHEGMISKRIRAEGGGYRFVFQEVAEYLVYRYLSADRASAGDELASWAPRVTAAVVFPEYAGAFGFLLRDWAFRDRLELAGPLLESAAEWLIDVAASFLIEQARSGYVPQTGSGAAERVAAALVRTGGVRCANCLHGAAFQLANSRFALAARTYYQACVILRNRLLAADPGNTTLADGLARVLFNLANMHRALGRVQDAEEGYRLAQELEEALWKANPSSSGAGNRLAWTLTSLSSLLVSMGRASEAETHVQKALQIRETLWSEKKGNVAIGQGLAQTFSSLGVLRRMAGRLVEADAAHSRALEIRETLWSANPQNAGIGSGLAQTLANLGILRNEVGRVEEAEKSYRRALEIFEALLELDPENIWIANRLAWTLGLLGKLLSVTRREAEAEMVLRRALEVREAQWSANPQNLDIGDGLAKTFYYLGRVYKATRRLDDAETAYRRALALRETLWSVNPLNVLIGRGLAWTLTDLGTVYRLAGRTDEAETALRRALEVFQKLAADNPQNVAIARGLAETLASLGTLLTTLKRASEAEATFVKALEIYESLWALNPHSTINGTGLAWTLNSLANLRKAVGQPEEAETANRRALEVREALWWANSHNVALGDAVAQALYSLGQRHRRAGQLEEMQAAYRRAMRIREALCALDSDSLESRQRLAEALYNLANSLWATRRAEEAETTYRRALKIFEDLSQANVGNVEIANERAWTLTSLGDLLTSTGRLPDAEAMLAHALSIRQALALSTPQNELIARGLVETLLNLGKLHAAVGQSAQAQEDLRRALGLIEPLRSAGPQSIMLKLEHADILASLQELPQAKTLVDEVLVQTPQNVYAIRLKRSIEAQRPAGESPSEHPA